MNVLIVVFALLLPLLAACEADASTLKTVCGHQIGTGEPVCIIVNEPITIMESP